MSLANTPVEAVGTFSRVDLVLDIMTAFLQLFAATLVLMHLVAPFVAPATDLDFLAMAYS
jgi:hypothetical protein